MNRTSAQNVLVSTTPSLEGWNIREYLGVVSAHVVAGTNIFSDIAASWRDVFGGQSRSYKKQLEGINEQVVADLRDDASALGGNALVGLRIDHDQISGQNKGMFMVTASATAVRAQLLSEPDSDASQEEERAVTARQVNVEERIVYLTEESQSGKLTLSESDWRFLIENQVSDLAEAIQTGLTEALIKVGGPRPKNQSENGRSYFLSIPGDKAKAHLYDMASHEERKVMDWAVGVLEDGSLLDLDRIDAMLRGDFYNEQKPALEILERVDKTYYEPKDIERLEALKLMIEKGFEKKGEVLEVKEKGVFSSGTKKVWQIEEGVHNPMNRTHCKKTRLNIYGFTGRETKPNEALRVLERKITALNRRFGKS